MATTLSLITPSFNQAQFIGQMLDSVAKQSTAPFEHIIYDGKSTDGSLEIIQSYAEQHKHVRLEVGKDSGQTNAINLGFQTAKGDILTWLNTDDHYVDDDILGDVIEFFEKNPDIDILYGRGEFVSDKGEVLREAYINRDDQDLKNRFITSLGILQPALFMRKSVFTDAGPLDESMDFSFDYEYWVRALFVGKKFKFWDRNVCHATIHSDAKTIRARKTSLRDCVTICKRYYGFAPIEWVDRITNHDLTGADGILEYEVNQTDEFLSHRDRLFRDLNDSKKCIEKAFSSAHLPQSKATMDHIKSLWNIESKQVILTTFDRHYFDQGLTMIAGVQKYHDSNIPIFVYNLGLLPEQEDLLSSLTNVFVLDYPHDDFDFFPEYFSPKVYGYKCLAMWHIQHILDTDSLALWIDAGVCPLQSLEPCFERIADDGVFFINHDDKTVPFLLNVACTSEECSRLMDATKDELIGDHLRSCLMGYRVNGPFQRLFDEAFSYSLSPDACTGIKHPKPPIYRTLDHRKRNERVRAIKNQGYRDQLTLEELREIFPYYGHRQDQSVLSILASRYKAPLSSATQYCLSCDESSEASVKNWESGAAAQDIRKRNTIPELYTNCDSITMQHRGVYQDHIGLKFEGINPDRPAIILGNGPSLRGFEFSNLNPFHVFGMNAAYRYWDEINWYPDYYSCLDTVVGLSHAEEIGRLIETSDETGIKLFLLRDNLVQSLGDCRHKEKVINFDQLRENIGTLQVDPITTGSHTAAWAAVLGYRFIYLLGVDCNYQEVVAGAAKKGGYELEIVEDSDNPNYFFDGYQRKGDAYNLPNPFKDLHLRSWRAVAETLVDSEATIRNANLESKVDCFDFCLFECISATENIDSIDPFFVLNSEKMPIQPAKLEGQLAFEDPIYGDDITIGVPSVANAANAKLDEFRLAWNLIGEKMKDGVLFDVGAHMGGGPLSSFVRHKWDVYAFEPDPKNRKALLANLGHHDNIVILDEAVSDSIATDIDFFSSDVSTGISGLTAFHDSHEKSTTVSTTTLDAAMERFKLDRIDCLKIDVEGHEMSVLRGLDFNKTKPKIIVAEFEDSKTTHHGYDSHDLAKFFVERGYHVYVSEWHPIEQYGGNHSWRSLKSYPCEIPSTSWGNFIAVLNRASEKEISDQLKRAVQFKSPKPDSLMPTQQIKDAKKNVGSANNSTTDSQQNTTSVSSDDTAYAAIAKRIKARSPLMFRLLQFPAFCLKQLRRRPWLGLIMMAALLSPLTLDFTGLIDLNGLLLWGLTGATGVILLLAMLIAYIVSRLLRRSLERQIELENQVKSLRQNHDTRLINIRADLENNVARMEKKFEQRLADIDEAANHVSLTIKEIQANPEKLTQASKSEKQ